MSEELLLIQAAGRTYRVRLLFRGRSKIVFEIDGIRYSRAIPNFLTTSQEGLPATTSREKRITAPMPGVINSISITPGENVSLGAPCLVLEAMKMENILVSPVTGKALSIQVKVGDLVKKGDILIEFE